MRITKSLCIFKKTNHENYYNIASYHRPDSIAWRWVFSLNTKPWKGERKRPYYNKLNGGVMWGFWLPFVGKFGYQSQQNMFSKSFCNYGKSTVKPK